MSACYDYALVTILLASNPAVRDCHGRRQLSYVHHRVGQICDILFTMAIFCRFLMEVRCHDYVLPEVVNVLS